MLRLPGFYHLKDPAQPFQITVEHADPSLVYSLAEMEAAFPAPEADPGNGGAAEPSSTVESTPAAADSISDEKLIEIACHATNGAKFRKLWVRPPVENDPLAPV